jgi:hypothetical protein
MVATGASMTQQQGSHHCLVGYDRLSGMAVLAHAHAIPLTHLPLAKHLAEVGPDDPFVTRCYPLAQDDACNVASAIGAVINTVALNFFLEGVAEGPGGN